MHWHTGLSIAAGMAALASMLPTSVAQAGPTPYQPGLSITAYSDCPAGWFCVWEHRGGTGRMARYQNPVFDLGAMDNTISSLWNRTAVTWCAYADATGIGGKMRVGPSWQGDVPGSMNDNISALRPGGC
ncbi:peptidase inhibitor family I36 protein [Saccharothrix sp. AJ9571]|nr:peptidase inhibitor family I36 protein [Saccharothrix sp. AJ9571]